MYNGNTKIHDQLYILNTRSVLYIHVREYFIIIICTNFRKYIYKCMSTAMYQYAVDVFWKLANIVNSRLVCYYVYHIKKAVCVKVLLKFTTG